MENKVATSNVEDSREIFEEPIRTVGAPVRVEQLWRDSNLIPTKAPTIDLNSLITDEGYKFTHAKKARDGMSIRNIVDYYYQLPLDRVSGTDDCYTNLRLKNIITADIFGATYAPIIYVDNNVLAYGKGLPYFDVAAGTLRFGDVDFAKSIKGSIITLSFYKYVGKTGMFGSDLGNIDLPFRDDIKHFKSADNDNATATFKVKGGEGNTNYVLPPSNGMWYDKGDSENTGVVVLQENLENVIWEQNVRISGGEWRSLGSDKTVVYKYDNPSIENGKEYTD